ncbi:tail fiber assembly protein [Vibrio owensii]|uniref:Phage tail assembly chaperone-like domain-containing protein n=1 Tax=Vibrio owensii CAIM 1854 = LMG 25443 TaxID=1229493 RepID=A0A0C1VMC0_9VIBR|nr:tail fiber assembly protein [Vibrio owensii]KIF50963.1 hypothetical protein H735_21910 [Vibrio owensii CAIM 1854 = LMG 25443]
MIKAEYYGSKESEEYQVFLENYWGMVRQKRDELIAKTDWTQVPDVPLTESKKTEFANYRQSLRDIPQNYSHPDDIVWPDMPAEA